ncbi:MAG TPA: methyltransferase regulatory domain-containing protein [Pirellulaceae bacterium]|nr:methyltransferase regulatory domain-containing protein [Pirellulaceae bacterium]
MRTLIEVERTSYDEVPYDSYPFPQSHPNRLATIARLLGMNPAPLETCRVLELGCASGGNLIPMAAAMPQATFLGIDASKRQIEQGEGTINDLGLQNIQLLHLDILNFDEQFSKSPENGAANRGTEFDYLICHGVYSWVPDRVQEQILAICAGYLSRQGVAYISYNTNPGWRMRGMIRDVMSYRANFFESPEAQTQEARALLDFLAAAVAKENNPYGLLLNHELEVLRTKADHYLFHEHLEEHNEPLYFHQFMERAAAKQLQYLGEAEYSMMAASNFPPEVERMVRRLASSSNGDLSQAPISNKPRVSEERSRNEDVDIIQLEQYMDFVRNRMFRQTLLCHGDVQLSRMFAPERLFGMHVASPAEPEQPIQDIHSRESVVFRRPGSSLMTADPLVKAAMVSLRAAWPASILFEDLVTHAVERLCPGPLLVDADHFRRDALRVAAPLLNCYATGHVDIRYAPVPYSAEIAEHPVACPLARLQATQAGAATTRWHGLTRLDDLERRLLPLLDGQHNRMDLIETLRADVAAERLVLRDKGGPVSGQERTLQILEQMIDRQLAEISRKGLLVAS